MLADSLNDAELFQFFSFYYILLHQVGALPSHWRLFTPLAIRAVGRLGRDRAGPDGADEGRAGAGHPAKGGHRQGRRHVVGNPLRGAADRGAPVQSPATG